ncbi:MAG: Bug family tripartite tricarboxylate transporter substrate binding protein, partial [Burkholderiaceae bacterium]
MDEKQMPMRRTVLKWMAAGAAGPAGLTALHAAEFPERQVKIINPTAPGGTVDMVSRIMGEKMAPHLGKPVVVEHRPGGSGAIGASLVSKGPKDGYMMFIGTSSTLGFMKMLNKDLAYEPVKDFTPISLVGSVPIGIFTSGTSGIKTV